MWAFFELFLIAILIKSVVMYKWARQICIKKWEKKETLNNEKEIQKAKYNGAKKANLILKQKKLNRWLQNKKRKAQYILYYFLDLISF